MVWLVLCNGMAGVMQWRDWCYTEKPQTFPLQKGLGLLLVDEPRLFQLFLKEIGYLAQQVVACVAAIDTMVAVGIIQFFEVFVGLNK